MLIGQSRRTERSIRFSAKRSAYSDMPSEISHSAVVDITFRPGAFAPRKHNTAFGLYQIRNDFRVICRIHRTRDSLRDIIT